MIRLLLFLFLALVIQVSCKSDSASKGESIFGEPVAENSSIFGDDSKANTSNDSAASDSEEPEVIKGDNIVRMEKVDGVYEIPTKINDVPMRFIFDTGAGMISISLTEANFLYKGGSLKKEDIVGVQDFVDANGDVTEGAVIILDKVQIGNRTLRHVEASVVGNQVAPLLMGQTALSKFGKISIDYKQGTISFE